MNSDHPFTRRGLASLPAAVLLGLLLAGCPPRTKPAATGDGRSAANSAAASTADASAPKRTARQSPDGPKKAFAVREPSAVPTAASFAAIDSARVRQAAVRYPQKPDQAPAAPMSLTASDGTGLQLVALDARAAIEGPLALTELQLTFRNPKPREIEGRFAITLPTGATISRFAMKLASGQWQEAEVVERQRARQVYEDFLHRRQDPALLEKKGGNQFRARVFPIPAAGIKEIKIGYSQQLARSTAPYRLPLLGLPTISRLEIVAFLGKRGASGVSSTLGGMAQTQQLIRVTKENWKPDRDFVVSSLSPVQGLRHENLAVARLAPKLGASATASIEGLLVLVDTSASRAAGFAAQISKLGELLSALAKRHGAATRLELVCFDQVVSPLYAGTLGGFGDRQLQAILARRALGASNLYAALRWARQRHKQPAVQRVLLFGDGVATAGLIEGDDLNRAAVALRGAGIERIDAVVTGGIRDEAALLRLVRGTVPSDGVVLDGDELGVDQLAARLSAATVSGIEVSVEGARWVWPSRLDGVQQGDEVLVYADVPGSAGTAPLKITLSGAVQQQVTVKVNAAKRPLLEREWVKARIDRLNDRRDRAADGDADLKQAIRKQIIDLSVRHRVLTDHTALLVLETEEDYRRYGIRRRALANILTVGAGGVQLLQRERAVTSARRPTEGFKADRREQRPPGGPTADQPQGSTAPPAQPVTGSRDEGGAADNKDREAPTTVAPSPDEADGEKKEAVALPLRTAKRRARPPTTRRPAIMRPPPPPRPRPRPRRRPAQASREKVPAYSGRMAKVMRLVQRGQADAALVEALGWRAESPGDVLALIALGEALTRKGKLELAARAYGSIIDLFPSRADMRRFAGERLEALGKVGQALAADTYAEAARQRPDHPASHRLLAFALLRLGQHPAAFEALAAGLARQYPDGRFRGVTRILREDLGLIAAAWVKADPAQRQAIVERTSSHGAQLPGGPSLRFVLNWETDANDVDFHIHDGRGGHAWYSHMTLESGGSLYADVTTGYGPECFAIEGKARAFPYRLQAHYYSRGPMGYGMGKLEIIQHDGQGGLRFEQRPFVVMNDGAYVDLGKVTRPL